MYHQKEARGSMKEQIGLIRSDYCQNVALDDFFCIAFILGLYLFIFLLYSSIENWYLIGKLGS